MNEIKLALTNSQYGFGFEVYRKTEITYTQFDLFKQKLLKVFNKILSEFID